MRTSNGRISTDTYFYDSEGNATKTEHPVTWDDIRIERNKELDETDWWTVGDRTMSDAEKNYRTFLRDLPSNYSTPKEAQTAWLAYDMTGL
tara:strand:- start:116 stop:388 length:273 start_codon:yes stop_codon:yes gene_type:complete